MKKKSKPNIKNFDKPKILNLLSILYYYPPMGSVSTQRTVSLLDSLTKAFEKTTVLRPKFCTIPFGENRSLSSNIEMKTLLNLDYRYLKSSLWPKDQSSYLSGKQSSFLSKLLFRFLESPLGALSIGEGGLIYIIQGYLKARKIIKIDETTHLLSSYRPLADLIIGYFLKKKHPKLIWVVDMRDHFIRFDSANYFIKSWRLAFFKRLLAKADHIISVSEGVSQLISKSISKEVKSIPNAYIPNQFKAKKNDTFTLSYTGSLYSFYPLDSFFELLKRWLIEKDPKGQLCQLNYAGKDSGIWEVLVQKYGLSKWSINHGLISLLEAQKNQRNSDINLMFSYCSDEYFGVVTGKISTLIGAQRRILCFINGALDNDLMKYFSDLKCGLVYATRKSKKEEVLNFLDNAFSEWTEDITPRMIISKIDMKSYSWETREKELYEYLDL